MRVESLNESHRRHLLTSVEYVDDLLSEIEKIVNAADSRSPFPKYRADLTPALGKTVRDYIDRTRALMLQFLESQGIGPRDPQVGALHSIRVHLTFIRIALTEIGPKYMRGFGEVPEAVAAELNGFINEGNTLVEKLDSYLSQGLEQDPGVSVENDAGGRGAEEGI